MSVHIYLAFAGNCEAAFKFYRSVFGGEFSDCNTFVDGPPDMEIPEEAKGKSMHVSLPISESVLMGSDRSPDSPPLNAGNNFSIAFSGTDRAHCDRVYAALADGGNAHMPMQETFWGAYFGALEDKYGI